MAKCQQIALRLPVWLIRVINGCFGLFGVVYSTVSAQVANAIASCVPGQPSTLVATTTPSLGSQQSCGNRPAPGDNEDDDTRPVAASYSRYSSENQNDSSIEDQQRRTREEASRLGFRLPPELQYDDHAISGTKLERAGLQQMLADAKSSKFQVIMFYSLSRLGRESAITSPILKQLVAEFDIRVISIADGIDSNNSNWEFSELFTNLQNEKFITNLAFDVFRGQEGTILSGFAVGDHRFGYASIESPNGERRGRGRNSLPRMVYVINEDQAQWVRQIFNWFVIDRRSISWIVRELNRLEAPKDHRSTTTSWRSQLVVGALRSEKYTGNWTWGARRNRRRPSDGKVTQVPRSAADTQKWNRSRPDLRIIDQAIFDAAQKILDDNAKRNSGRRDTRGRLHGCARSIRDVFQCI